MNEFEPWTEYLGIPLARHSSGAYTYTTDHVALDADGSLFAYHPANIGRDDLSFASWPDGAEDWRSILVADPADPNRPYVQTEGPAKGYFLSMTTLQATSRSPIDARKYVDSELFPYLVFPANFLKIPGVGDFGDLAVARNLESGLKSWAIAADQGPACHPLGEISLRLAENLGGSNVNPRNGEGMASGPVQYIIFPNSRLDPPWPHSAQELESVALQLFEKIGGLWPRATSELPVS